jgi:flagellar biosynthetic protein FliQ
MDTTSAVSLARQAVMLMLIVGAPVLVVGMAVGLIISVLQAVTQIQEQTLSFVPKIIVMVLVSAAVAPWAAAKLVTFATQMWGELP